MNEIASKPKTSALNPLSKHSVAVICGGTRLPSQCWRDMGRSQIRKINAVTASKIGSSSQLGGIIVMIANCDKHQMMNSTPEHKPIIGDDGELIEADRNINPLVYSEYVRESVGAVPNHSERPRWLTGSNLGTFAVFAVAALFFAYLLILSPLAQQRVTVPVPAIATQQAYATPDVSFSFIMPQTGRSLFFGYGIQAVQNVQWSPDGRYLALQSDSDRIRTWQVNGENRNLPVYDHISHFDWLSDSNYLVMVKDDQSTFIVSGYAYESPTALEVTGDTQVKQILAVESGPPQLLASSSAGLIAFVTVQGQYLSILDLDQTKVIYNTRFSQPIRDIAWSSDGQQLLIVTNEGIWNWTSEKSANLLLNGEYYRAVWSPDAQEMAATAMLEDGSPKPTVAVIDISEQTVNWDAVVSLFDLYSAQDWDSYVQWSPTGSTIATYYKFNNSIDLWDSATGNRIMRYSHTESVYAVDWSPDGRYIAVGSLSGVTIWSPSVN